MSQSPIRVVLADDHEIVRQGLKALVNAEPDMQVVGEAADGDAAYRLACELRPEILIVDLSMPQGGGAAAAERVRAECADVKIIALTVHEEPQYVGHRAYVSVHQGG